MILAAPLVIPFAKAVGLSVGTLGMAALADKVNDYIQDNPEESMKILSTIIPNVGIGQIFMSKEDKISLEDLEDMTDEEAQDLTKEEKAELMKQAGKSGGGKKGKRQTMIDISEKLGLSGPGREKQDIEYEVDERYDEGGVEDAPKPKFDYTKFFRKRRADGGAIGIEVLFREKKNLGGLLTGQAKNIYDTMSAAGYFTEDEIRNAIINAGYEIPGTTTTTTPVTNVTPNIINQGGDGDGGSPPPGPTDPYAGLGYSSANFGLGKGINKDAVMDYEADAYEIGRTPLGQLSRFGIGTVNALKNLPTPFNLARKAIEFAKQKELEKKAREEAIARDLARSIQEQNIANRTGGYGFGYSPSSDFMSGGSQGKGGFDNTEAGIGAASAAMGSSKDGGLMGYGGKSGTPRGVTSMFVEKR
jgi:hypothetical protein